MSRRRTNTLSNTNENLSKETEEVQNELLEEIINPEDNQDNDVEPVLNENEETNNLSNEETEEKPVEPGDNNEFKPGDIVKIRKDVKFDIMGRRIHNGLKGYTYTILSVRIDGMLIVECLTHCFTLQPSDVERV